MGAKMSGYLKVGDEEEKKRENKKLLEQKNKETNMPSNGTKRNPNVNF